MRHIPTALFVFFLFLFNTANSQHCANSVPVEQCDVSGLTDGFISADLLQCITQGQRTETAIPFKVFAHIPNTTDSVYRMKIESVSNLPCGLCWVSNNTANTFNAGEGGCIIVQGTSNDAAGQYTLSIVFSFDTNGNGTWTQTGVSLNSLVSSNGKIILRLLSTEESCGAINYSANGNTAATSCN